jgi:hypothetical protein
MTMDDDMLAQLQADAEEVAAAAPAADLTHIAQLARDVVTAQLEVLAAQKTLADASKKLLDLETKTLPEAMDSAQMKEFTTVDGLKIEVAPVISASISGPKKPFVCQWLRDNDQEELIKPTITVVYGKGALAVAQERATALSDELRDTAAVSVEEDVNTASFKALIKELRDTSPEEAAKIPYEELGVYVGRKASVKLPPKKKQKS